MAKRARSKPLDEGPLKDIYNYLFKPIVDRFADSDQSAHSFMERLFNVDSRHIEKWQAVRQFEMPGLYYVSGRVRLQGVGARRVNKWTILMVRRDDTGSGVDVEFFGGQGGKDLVYHLSDSEWGAVKLNLTQENVHAVKPRRRNRVRRRRVRRVHLQEGLKGQGQT